MSELPLLKDNAINVDDGLGDIVTVGQFYQTGVICLHIQDTYSEESASAALSPDEAREIADYLNEMANAVEASI